jgi:DNA invertase Pin-like site-specific DNA recombinase
MIYGYARVSSKGQASDGNGLDVQEKALMEHGAIEIFKDSFTGMKKHRPNLDGLLLKIQEGDTLVVTKLDRIARSARQGCELVGELLNRGITINVLNMGVMDNSTTGKLIRTIFFAFDEFERDMIVERTNEGKEIAKSLNPAYKEGRKTKELPEFENFLQKQKDGKLTVKQCCNALNISKTTWYDRARQSSGK